MGSGVYESVFFDVYWSRTEVGGHVADEGLILGGFGDVLKLYSGDGFVVAIVEVAGRGIHFKSGGGRTAGVLVLLDIFHRDHF